ncbi:MAG: cell wall hydrolase [Candidatus Magasanikbacteria bacterium]|nr:cell wall hydrolase [Candidatus Magasanikbacteria bacterium]
MPESKQNFPKTITADFEYTFKVSADGLYAITINARCRSIAQTGASNDEDLRVEIAGRQFRELPPIDKVQYYNIPPAWNGTELKGLTKTIVFILRLAAGDWRLKLTPRGEAVIERQPAIHLIANLAVVEFKPDTQAEDGDRRPWYTFVLVGLPLQSVSADVSVGWHWWDGDDVKLVIDGAIQKNSESRFHRGWLWSASLWQLFGDKREQKRIEVNLQRGLHYIEFGADRTPTLHAVSLDLGAGGAKRTPTREDPKWTGNNFADDSDQMILARMIFGEARSASNKARAGVGWTARNRLTIGGWRGRIYREVILKNSQYSAFNQGDPNRLLVEDPLRAENLIDKQAWLDCYDLAGQIIAGEVDDPTNGATNYYDQSITAPSWATKENFIIKIDTIFFHRL